MSRKLPKDQRTHTIAFRTGDTLRDRIVEAARRSGRSVAQEVEHRIGLGMMTETAGPGETRALQVLRALHAVMQAVQVDQPGIPAWVIREGLTTALKPILREFWPDAGGPLADVVNQCDPKALEKARAYGTKLAAEIVARH